MLNEQFPSLYSQSIKTQLGAALPLVHWQCMTVCECTPCGMLCGPPPPHNPAHHGLVMDGWMDDSLFLNICLAMNHPLLNHTKLSYTA